MKRVLVLLAAVLLHGSDALAWGHEGHRAIALIAEPRLTPQAKAKLKDIFGYAPNLADLSLCADEVRSYETNPTHALSPACARVFPEPPQGTAGWHYVDVDADIAHPTDQQIIDACAGVNCAVLQIPRDAAVLRNSHAANEDRARAATLLIHFVGDLHQPLHGAERNKDRGGNEVQVQLLGGPARRLHSVWDGDVPKLIAPTDKEIVAKLGREIREAEQERAQQVSLWAILWARESHAAARATAYAGVAMPPAISPLDQAYADAAAAVARRRIAQAGVRLAAVLNEALK